MYERFAIGKTNTLNCRNFSFDLYNPTELSQRFSSTNKNTLLSKVYGIGLRTFRWKSRLNLRKLLSTRCFVLICERCVLRNQCIKFDMCYATISQGNSIGHRLRARRSKQNFQRYFEYGEMSGA